VLNARAVVTVQRGEVYLYDGNSPDRDDAQRLILADTAELDAVATADVEFFAAGSITANKSFAGDAVGEQDAIELSIDCGEGYTFTAEIDAGATTASSFTYEGIPLGRTCTVEEPETGATTEVSVTTDAPQSAEITTEGASVTITNTVTFLPGGLRVVKTLDGPAAAEQGEITLTIDCGDALADTFTLDAGTAAGTYDQTYSDLPAGTECTITETSSGATSTVEVTGSDPTTVTIPAGATIEATLTNTARVRGTGGLIETGGVIPLGLLLGGVGSVGAGAWMTTRRPRRPASPTSH
jgi:hypothetical protein